LHIAFKKGRAFGRHHPPSITSEELDNLVGYCPPNSAVSLFDLFAPSTTAATWDCFRTSRPCPLNLRMLACRPIYAFQPAILLHVAPQMAMIIYQYFVHIYPISFHPDPWNHI